MYFQFLIEDHSGEELIHQIMGKMFLEYPDIEYRCKSFHGIGGFTKKNTVKETKTGKLLNDLATYLKGFNKSLQNMSDATIVVVVDNDDRETTAFYTELETLANNIMITLDHVFCIAVEEMEAWLLGDENAILAAYPNAKLSLLRNYEQDSICGTWEVLADMLYKSGRAKLKRNSPYYGEIGKLKSEWARNIGAHMSIHDNNSPSFNHFINVLEERLKPKIESKMDTHVN